MNKTCFESAQPVDVENYVFQHFFMTVLEERINI